MRFMLIKYAKWLYQLDTCGINLVHGIILCRAFVFLHNIFEFQYHSQWVISGEDIADWNIWANYEMDFEY